MHRFFVSEDHIDKEFITITGSDINHIKNVLRMKAGDELLISNGLDKDYYCRLYSVEDNEIKAKICGTDCEGGEPEAEFYLFQCLPKGDKMELIVQKAVELGAKEIIPVASKRSIVKLDEKKAESRVNRWNAIAESAAKQSHRIIIPKVHKVMSFNDAVDYASDLDKSIIPYENYKDMTETRQILDSIKQGMKVGIFIGPEGGFEGSEVETAINAGICRVSLGKRILRTETAGMAVLAILMFKLER